MPGYGPHIVAPGEAGGPEAVEQQKWRAIAPLFKVPPARVSYPDITAVKMMINGRGRKNFIRFQSVYIYQQAANRPYFTV
jgi:hypothetical protein